MVFDNEWFNKHQYTLLKLANTAIGRHIFGIKKQSGIVVQLMPDSYHYLNHIDRGTGMGRIKSSFFSSNYVALNLYKNLKWFWKALHSIDSLVLDHQRLVPDFGFSTLTNFEGATGPGQSFDQDMYTVGSASGWASVKSKTTADTIHSTVDIVSVVGIYASYLEYITLYRAISCFYTGGTITEGSIIESATFSAVIAYSLETSKFWSAGDHGTVLVGCDINDPEDQLVSGDWDAFDLNTAISGELLTTNIDEDNYNDYTLNSSGLAIVSDTGTTQLGIVMIGDRENITPSYTPLPEGIDCTTGFLTNDYSGASYPNKLDVTWYTPINLVKINIGDDWKEASNIQINIGDSWKTVNGMKINIGDAWKDIF